MERVPRLPDSIDLRVIPFIEINPRPKEKIQSHITGFAGEKQNIIFTSAQAVRAVTVCLQQLPDWKIYCVGKETRLAIKKYFGDAAIAKMAANAQELSALIFDDKIKQIVFFCSDQRMDILPENLKKQGVNLTELVVYDTRLTPVRITESPDAVLFFSPTAVKSFFSINVLSPATQVFAMGTSTAAALKLNTIRPVIISPEADKVYVLKLALEYAGSHP
jgi:uroporphyrinogen-III synthase